uniref:CTLH domain-containing protein n=1 Tax=Rhizophora mucronata TaxID=61149 RepID=A0A2P2JT92_RHIMU
MEMDSLPNGNSATASPATTAAPNAAPSSKLTQLTESLKLEHQFLRVPFEHYKKTIRANHRAVEKEVSSVVSGVAEAADSDMSKDEAVQHLTSLVSRLQGLKRKLEEGGRTENLQAQRCRARLDHLESADAENLSEWSNMRLKRILVDYMLRMSYYETGTKLAESSNMLDLVDIDVFQEAKKVIDALQNRDVAPALAWCADNRSRLKKTKSKLEFQLRLQDFIELVRDESFLRAIVYARKYLAPWAATHMNDFQRVISTLAFKSATECAPYKVYQYLQEMTSLLLEIGAIYPVSFGFAVIFSCVLPFLLHERFLQLNLGFCEYFSVWLQLLYFSCLTVVLGRLVFIVGANDLISCLLSRSCLNLSNGTPWWTCLSRNSASYMA